VPAVTVGSNAMPQYTSRTVISTATPRSVILELPAGIANLDLPGQGS